MADCDCETTCAFCLGIGDVVIAAAEARTPAVGCILTGDWEVDADCTQFHDDAPNDCCRYCEADGQHCGMCQRYEVDEADVRNYVSRLWAEDWDSPEDSADDMRTRYLKCAACEDAPAGETGLCTECLDTGDDEPVDPDPWLDELGPIGGGS